MTNMTWQHFTFISGVKPRKGISVPVLNLDYEEEEEEEEEEESDGGIGSPAKRTKSRSPKSAQLMNKVRTELEKYRSVVTSQ